MIHKNFNNIDKVIYGRGSFSQLAETIAPTRIENNNYFVYIIDNYFKGKELSGKIQNEPSDLIYFIDVDPCEPTTELIDDLRNEILLKKACLAALLALAVEASWILQKHCL